MKIRNKILSSFLPLVILPPVILVAIAMFGVTYMSKDFEPLQEALQNVTQTLEQSDTQIQKILNDRLQTDYTFMAKILTQTFETVDSYSREKTEDIAALPTLAAYLQSSEEKRKSMGAKPLIAAGDMATKTSFSAFRVLDPTGAILFQEPTSAADLSDAFLKEFIGGRKSKSAYIPPDESKKAKPVIHYAAPILRIGASGQTERSAVGWVVMDLPVATMAQRALHMNRLPTGQVRILDAKKSSTEAQKNPIYATESKQWEAADVWPIRSLIMDGALTVEYVVPWQEIQDAVAGIRGIVDSVKEETVHAAQSSTRLSRMLANSRKPFSIILVLIIVAAIGCILLLARVFTLPIIRLDISARKLAGGVLDIDPRLPQQDEIGDLSRSFDHMRLRLREHIHHLDDLVAAKTSEIQERAKETRELIMRMDDAFVLLNIERPKDPAILMANPTFGQLAGRADDSINWMTLREALPWYPPEEFTRLVEIAESGQPSRFELHTADDRYFVVSAYSPADKRMALMLADVTVAKRAAAEAQRIENGIQHTQRIESLGQLASGIAHEFNNLLMSILGNADMALLDVQPGTEVFDNLNDIQKSAIRAGELCRQMLDFSGDGQSDLEPTDLSTLIRNMGSLIDVAVAKNIEVVYPEVTLLPPVAADVSQLRQTLLSIFTNASESMGAQTSGKIRVKTHVDDLPDIPALENPAGIDLPAGKYVTIDVIDSGTGIEPDVLEHIFEPFFTTKGEGRGLGLAATLGIIRRHKGYIRIQTKPGEGVTFSISLPALSAGSENSEATEEKPRLHVLVADSEQNLRSVFVRLIQKQGARTQECSNAQELLSRASQLAGKFVVLFIAPTLEGGNFAATLQNVRELLPNLQVVITSSRSMDDIRDDLGGQPVDGYLQKPYQAEKIKSCIKEIQTKLGIPL